MSEENVFTSDQASSQAGETNTEVSTLFEIGDRKYDAEAARKKIEAADEHIKRIEQENADLRAKAAKAASVDEVLEAIKKKQETGQNPTSSDDGLDIHKMVQEAYRETVQASRKAENLETANKRMQEKYGGKAKEVLESRAKELGVSVGKLKAIAEDSPDAFLQFFEVGQQTSTASPHSEVNTEAVPHDQPKKYTWAYYQQMKKDNPSSYASAQVQAEMIQKAGELGQAAFFGE
jgi:hypothetical protein